MPQITIKTKYADKLKELGVYDQWLENVKTQWNDGDGYNFTNDYFYTFISRSFLWGDTPEGGDFWIKIAHTYD